MKEDSVSAGNTIGRRLGPCYKDYLQIKQGRGDRGISFQPYGSLLSWYVIEGTSTSKDEEIVNTLFDNDIYFQGLVRCHLGNKGSIRFNTNHAVQVLSCFLLQINWTYSSKPVSITLVRRFLLQAMINLLYELDLYFHLNLSHFRSLIKVNQRA